MDEYRTVRINSHQLHIQLLHNEIRDLKEQNRILKLRLEEETEEKEKHKNWLSLTNKTKRKFQTQYLARQNDRLQTALRDCQNKLKLETDNQQRYFSELVRLHRNEVEQLQEKVVVTELSLELWKRNAKAMENARNYFASKVSKIERIINERGD